MAKIKCKSCGDMIDDGAKFCAHCGTEVNSKDGRKFIMNLLILVVAILVIAFSCDSKKKEGDKASPAVVTEASVGESIANEIINDPTTQNATKEAEKSLNVSLKWWVSEVNKALKNIGMPAMKRGKKSNCNVSCVESFSIGKFVSLAVSHDGDKIDSMMVFASSDGSVKAASDISVVNIILGQVFSPNTPKKEITTAIFNAVTDSISNDELKVLSFDGIKYIYQTNIEMGFVATITKSK